MAKLRLNKILAQAGLSSRRGADRLIADGRVAINGAVTRELATLADPERDLVTVDGLDWDVEGALLMTNDGALTHRLLHPRYGLPRVYEADVDGRVPPGALERWRRGVVLDDGPARPLEVEILHGARDATLMRLTFAEG